MSQELIATDLQEQTVDSPIVTLFELILPDGASRVYFFSGTDSDLTSVHHYDNYKDSNGNYNKREYESFPVLMDGIELATDGAPNRPTITIANIGTLLNSKINNLKFKDLIGQKVVRRQTLQKYLASASDSATTTTAPTELSSSTFVIDRISSENAIGVTFELALVYDLQGVALPNRVIIGKYCSWMYQGFQIYGSGGCTWDTAGKYEWQNGGASKSTNYYFDINNKPIVQQGYLTTNATNWSNSTSYTTASYVYKDDAGYSFSLATNGLPAITAGKTRKYYVSLFDQSGNTPSSTSSFWKEALPYVTYNNSHTYEIGQHVRQSITKQPENVAIDTTWKAILQTSGNTPSYSSAFWSRGDQCGKTLNSCKCRFQATQAQVATTNTAPSGRKNTTVHLPFGAFPGAAKF